MLSPFINSHSMILKKDRYMNKCLDKIESTYLNASFNKPLISDLDSLKNVKDTENNVNINQKQIGNEVIVHTFGVIFLI